MGKKISFVLAVYFLLFIFGCAGSSKVIKSSNETMPVRAEERMVSRIPVAIPPNQVVGSSHVPVIAPVKPTLQIKPDRIPYSQITKLIGDLIDIKKTSDIIGDTKYLGISDNKLVVMEITGDKDDIDQASIKLIYPKGIDKHTADLNNAMMARFLKNAAPEFTDWSARVRDIFARFNSMPPKGGGINREDIIVRNKLIEVLYDKNIGAVTLMLRRAND